MTIQKIPITTNKTIITQIDHIKLGGGLPVVVQSMTNTDTSDIKKTVNQISDLVRAGSEMVRLTVNNHHAAAAISEIKNKLIAQNINVPLIGDFHFNGHKLLTENPDCAQALSKYRINPGNVGKGKKRDIQFATMIELACQYDKPVRIGVNWGSLDQQLLASLMDQNSQLARPATAQEIMRQAVIESALQSAQQAINWGLAENKIILSCKMSNVQDLIAVYQQLAQKTHHPLHLGLTEAGMGTKGIVSSTAALSILLQLGIGDTIRVSLTPEPGGDRILEVTVAQEILQSLGLRAFTPSVTACPGCGRTTSTYFQDLALEIQQYIKNRMPVWRKKYKGAETLKIAVMGCVVNGPGESKLADIGISLPGTGEKPIAPVYEDGSKTVTLKGDNIAQEFQALVEAYVQRRFSAVNA